MLCCLYIGSYCMRITRETEGKKQQFWFLYKEVSEHENENIFFFCEMRRRRRRLVLMTFFIFHMCVRVWIFYLIFFFAGNIDDFFGSGLDQTLATYKYILRRSLPVILKVNKYHDFQSLMVEQDNYFFMLIAFNSHSLRLPSFIKTSNSISFVCLIVIFIKWQKINYFINTVEHTYWT